MTIGEKASEYAEKSFPSNDISNYGKHDVAFHSHIAGARWMLDKAAEYIKINIQFTTKNGLSWLMNMLNNLRKQWRNKS